MEREKDWPSIREGKSRKDKTRQEIVGIWWWKRILEERERLSYFD
jgi:hypothetical protein